MTEYSEKIRQCGLELRRIQIRREAATKPVYKLERAFVDTRLELIRLIAEKNK